MRPFLDILRLVWPLALGMVNNAAMQFVDRAYLAHYGLDALEAIMPATTLAWVFLSFFQAVVGYSGVFVSQYQGAGDAAGCVRSCRAGFVTAALSALALVPLVPLGDLIFRLTATTPTLVAMESDYCTIVLWGGFFLLAQMAATAYFTGLGLTRIVFWVNLTGNLINIALDPVLIFGWWGLPRLGMAGAAYATVASQAVQFVVLTMAVARHTAPQRIPLMPTCADGALLLRILRFGIPSGGYEVLNMLSFTVFIFITGRMDPLAFAVSNACFTINYLLFAPMMGFALGAQTLVGQACGRGEIPAAHKALMRTLLLALGFLVLVLIGVLAAERPLLALFSPPELAGNAQFHDLGFRLLLVMSAWILFDATDIILAGALKGAGDTKFVFWWMFICSFLIWLPVVGICFACKASMPVMWSTMVFYVVIITMGSVVRWLRGRWRRHARIWEG